MSNDRIERLEKSLQRLQEQDRDQRDRLDAMRWAVLACALSGALLALTTTTWRTFENSNRHAADPTTLWDMVPDGWQAPWTLGAVLTVAIGTMWVFLAGVAGSATHVVFAVVCALAAVGIMLLDQIEPHDLYDPETFQSAPGRWLTLLGVLALGVLHGRRVAELRR